MIFSTILSVCFSSAWPTTSPCEKNVEVSIRTTKFLLIFLEGLALAGNAGWGYAVKRPTYTFRTIWISDIHLGTRDCKAEFLLDFFKHTESETLYLVGDIVDGWKIRRGWFWEQSHSDVIQKTLRKARKGTEVIYVPGNHDEFLRDYVDMKFGNIIVKKRAEHMTADGRCLLIMHGDEFDGVMKYARWLAYVGDRSYEMALRLNRWVNHLRNLCGYPYWSLSAYLKHRVKKAVELISNFEHFLVDVARQYDADGVVCGHIHHAEIKEIDGILYCNDGDWVESCTALVEHYNGQLEIIYWVDELNKYHTKKRSEKREPEPA